MLLLIFFVSVMCSFAAFLPVLPAWEEMVPIYAFYLLLLRYMAGSLLMVLICVMILTLVVKSKLKFADHVSTMNKIVISFKQAILVVIIGILLAPLTVYLVGIAELNILAFAANINPSSIGIHQDTEVINQKLQKMNMKTSILIGNKQTYPIITMIGIMAAGENTFYSKNILPSIPEFMILPVKKINQKVILADNTVILNTTENKDIYPIASSLTYQIAGQVFPGREIKKLPNIYFVDKEEYQQFRSEDLKEKYERMDKEIASHVFLTQEIIKELEKDRELIIEAEESLHKIYKERETEYQECVAENMSVTVCSQVLREWDKLIVEANNDVKESKQREDDDTMRLKEQEENAKIFQAQKSVIKILENNILQEYGQFVPPDEIYATREDMEKMDVFGFLETLTHEYMHYAGYISPEKVLSDSFWEEGLSEYFARKAIKKVLDKDTNIGYPAAVKIISQMSRRIADSEFAEIYFSKDQELLTATLNRVYGDGFYESNRIYFTLIQYTSDPEQILKYANVIMKRIDGNLLTTVEMVSD